jgi:hypothetical protein
MSTIAAGYALPRIPESGLASTEFEPRGMLFVLVVTLREEDADVPIPVRVRL